MINADEVKIVFVGATWKGSSARSLREALDKLPTVFMDEVGEDHHLPLYRSKLLRGFNRLLKRWQVADLAGVIDTKLDAFGPAVLMVYKGWGVTPELIKRTKARGILTVNVYPDCSPHAFGRALRSAMGVYDLVVSTKPFHSALWGSTYGYSNPCVFVPHGYDPEVHFWSEPVLFQDYDVVLAASWRPEYHELMLAFARATGNATLRIGIAGSGWTEHRNEFPRNWDFAGPLYGRTYGDWVRRGKIVIAPVQTHIVADGVQQPGDEDSTRTYELASAFCFFLHRRTHFVQTVFDEYTEVPMWDNAEELAQKVLYYLPQESLRRAMACAAHARATPHYSIQARAAAVLEHVRVALSNQEALK